MGDGNAADFETAVAECGFGCFNVIILLCAVPSLWSMIFTAAGMSFVMPSAECDLGLSMNQKGLMNAITYAGMVISAIPWGFMADTIGRRPVMIVGGLIDGVLVVFAASSQNTTMLMVFKFFDGFVNCGPFAVIMSYLAEFHGKKHRMLVILFGGITLALGSILLSTMAYFMLAKQLDFSIGAWSFTTWHVFLLLSSVPTFVSGIVFIFLPESPKFLMAQGDYKKATACFQRIYAINKRKGRNEYPITTLTDNTPEKDELPKDHVRTRRELFEDAKHKFYLGLQQLKPMFSKQYRSISICVYILHICQIMSVNSLRLWMPGIFAALHSLEEQGESDQSICAVIKFTSNSSLNKILRKGGDECISQQSHGSYLDNIIVSCVCLVGFILIVPLFSVPKLPNHMLKICLFICTCLVAALYFATNRIITLIEASIYLALMGVCASTIIGMVIVVFPTLMRTMVLLLIMTVGRVGSSIGNVVLPYFIQMGCLPPFLWLTGLMAIAFFLSLFLKINVNQSLN